MPLLPLYTPIALAQAAFTIWMLVDAYRRRCDTFWLYVILFVPVVGAWAYFFTFKAPELHRAGGLSGVGGLFQRRASLDELRCRAEQTPTLANHLALAERLIERGEFAEALPHLEAARKSEPEHCQVLFNLALCHVRLGRPREAVAPLQTVIARNPAWSDYAAWHLLVQAQEQAGDNAGALETCRELARHSPTLKHQCLLAEYLLATGRNEEANQLLEQSLLDNSYAPAPIRRRNRPWVRVARQLQKQVPAR